MSHASQLSAGSVCQNECFMQDQPDKPIQRSAQPPHRPNPHETGLQSVPAPARVTASLVCVCVPGAHAGGKFIFWNLGPPTLPRGTVAASINDHWIQSKLMIAPCKQRYVKAAFTAWQTFILLFLYFYFPVLSFYECDCVKEIKVSDKMLRLSLHGFTCYFVSPSTRKLHPRKWCHCDVI